MFSWGELFSTFLVRKIMGAKGSCRSPDGGGVPFCMLSTYQTSPLFHPPFQLSSWQIFRQSWQIFRQSGKNRQKWINFWGCLVFYREFRRQERAKIKDILKSGYKVGARWCVPCLPFIVSTGPEVRRLSRLQDLPWVGSCPLVVCSCLLSALLLCPWCIGLKYGSISHFKAVFSGFCGGCVGLCCLGALRGLCGFCTRVELGGLKVCCVFASAFHLLCPCFCPFVLVSLCLLSFACPLSCLSSFVCSCVLCGFCCCFFFPFGIYAKKGAISCVLSFVCCECSKSCIVVEKLRCRCFGFFQFARLVLPTNTSSIRRLACFYFDFLRHYIDITYNSSAFLK